MKLQITQYNRDYYGGALMVLIGLGAVFEGTRHPIGSLSRMGPGFYPMALGVILALLGVAIALGARRATPGAPEKELPPEWRGWFCIVASVVAFIVIGRYGGLLPATFAIVFISALGDRDNTVKAAFWLSIAMVVIAWVVFYWALQLQFPLFQWGGR